MRPALTALLVIFAAGAYRPGTADAQAIGVVGTRARGMAGAFVGVADDASAVYWNPAGLAAGAYFSLVLDGNGARKLPEDAEAGAERSGWLLALSMPALGLSYYRLHSTTATVSPEDGYQLDALVTHHAGATLVQSLTDAIAVGTTLKLVRGTAGSGTVPATTAEDALDNWDIIGHSSSRFDLDVGIMATGAVGRLGLVIRNVTEPGFETGGGPELALERQVRAGGSMLLLPGWTLAADVDLTRTRTALGAVRELAFGTERQLGRRVAGRAGVRLNTAGNTRAPSLALGASYAVLGSLLLDAQVTGGSDESFRGWGIAGRVVF